MAAALGENELIDEEVEERGGGVGGLDVGELEEGVELECPGAAAVGAIVHAVAYLHHRF